MKRIASVLTSLAMVAMLMVAASGVNGDSGYSQAPAMVELSDSIGQGIVGGDLKGIGQFVSGVGCGFGAASLLLGAAALGGPIGVGAALIGTAAACLGAFA